MMRKSTSQLISIEDLSMDIAGLEIEMKGANFVNNELIIIALAGS